MSRLSTATTPLGSPPYSLVRDSYYSLLFCALYTMCECTKALSNDALANIYASKLCSVYEIAFTHTQMCPVLPLGNTAQISGLTPAQHRGKCIYTPHMAQLDQHDPHTDRRRLEEETEAHYQSRWRDCRPLQTGPKSRLTHSTEISSSRT